MTGLGRRVETLPQCLARPSSPDGSPVGRGGKVGPQAGFSGAANPPCQAPPEPCPGRAEYGHGFSRTTVHTDCCSPLDETPNPGGVSPSGAALLLIGASTGADEGRSIARLYDRLYAEAHGTFAGVFREVYGNTKSDRHAAESARVQTRRAS